jgi:hypothetical protein
VSITRASAEREFDDQIERASKLQRRSAAA